jgi:hypothetical protein
MAVRRAASVAVNNYMKNMGSTAVRIANRCVCNHRDGPCHIVTFVHRVALTSIAKAVYDKSIKKIDDDSAADSAAVVTSSHFDDESEDLQARQFVICLCAATLLLVGLSFSL